MRLGRRTLIVGLIVAVALCSSLVLASAFVKTSRTQGRAEVKVGEEFKLGVGRSAALKGGGLEVEFVSVVEDSRCPRGAECIWEGNARISLRLKRPRESPAEIELNTNLEPQRSSCLGYEVRLIGLSPYPVANEALDKKRYVAALEVRKL
ncbi:MAG TPA: hypothetical protein VK421_16980 [Pyrinomonadaceae bacterium]|nr:hypothetical protein [Pyrinomonadaceae bacterium]